MPKPAAVVADRQRDVRGKVREVGVDPAVEVALGPSLTACARSEDLAEAAAPHRPRLRIIAFARRQGEQPEDQRYPLIISIQCLLVAAPHRLVDPLTVAAQALQSRIP